MASDDDAVEREDDDNSAKAFKELIRVLEAAAWTGVESVGLEWKGNELVVFHESGNVGIGATKIAKPLQFVIGRFKTSHREALQNQPVGFMFGNVTVL